MYFREDSSVPHHCNTQPGVGIIDTLFRGIHLGHIMFIACSIQAYGIAECRVERRFADGNIISSRGSSLHIQSKFKPDYTVKIF